MADQRSPMELDAEKTPEILPILPLYDAALFPKMVLPLVVLQGESVQLVDEAMAKDRIIGLMVSKKPEDKDSPDREDLASIGTSAMILKMAKSQDNRTQLLVQGLNRFKIIAYEEGKSYLRARVEPVKDIEIKDNEIEALMSNLVKSPAWQTINSTSWNWVVKSKTRSRVIWTKANANIICGNN